MKKTNTVAIQITKEKNSYSTTVVGLYDVCTIEAKTYHGIIDNVREVLSTY